MITVVSLPRMKTKKETKVVKGDLFFVYDFSFVSFLVKKIFKGGRRDFVI